MTPSQVERLRAALAERYVIERELGQGGMAVVFLARDLRLERQVALKVLRPELSAMLGGERFLLEIRLTAQLQHPHVVAVHDSGDAGGLLYYVMQYLEGESLRQRLDREGPLPIEDAVRVACEVADALGFAHRHGIVHRDIKPDNILLSAGHALVADFGVARAADAAGLRLTETGLAVGTPAYMSPEQGAADPHVDGRADLYALGCVLYEMLAGDPPFGGSTAQVIVARHMTDQAPPLATVRPEVSSALEKVIRQALAKLPADRFASAEALAAALRAAATPTPATPAAAGTSRAPVWRGAALGVGALAVVAAALWTRSPGDGPAAQDDQAIRSIAVLPLRNSGDSSDNYFAEGIGEQIGSALVRVPGVTVHSWSAVLEAVKVSRNPAVLGPKLHVDYVLDGSFQRSGARTRVSMQLVRVADGAVIWSQPYDGTGTDIFGIQDSVSRGVAGELALRLSPSAQRALVHRTTQDLEAYNEYLLGRHFQWQLTVAALETAIGHYERAIARDSTYADAWQGLVEASVLRDQWGPGRRGPPVATLIDRVLALDSTNGAAHAFRAEQLALQWDFPGAERAYRLALRYNPGIAESYVLYAQFLNQTGRHAEALKQARHAAVLNPVASFVIANLAIRYEMVEQYDSAETTARRAIALDPGNWVAHFTLGLAQVGMGQAALGVASLEEAERRLGQAGAFRPYIGWAMGRAGRREDAVRIIAALDSPPGADLMRQRAADYVRLGLGDTAGVLDRLATAVAARRSDLTDLHFTHDPLFWAPLRQTPRYRGILRQLSYTP